MECYVIELTVGLHIHSEQQVVSNLRTVHFSSVRVRDGHDASRGRSGVGDGPRRRYHADVESQSDGLLSGVVDALDVVGLGAVRHQLGVLLDHENEGCIAIGVYEPARVEDDLEIDDVPLPVADYPPALVVLAVTFHVQDSIKGLQVNRYLDAVGQAHHRELG